MKKKDIKQDPIRDAFLSFITKIKENKQYSLPILGIFVIGFPLLVFMLSNREIEEDYIECSNSSSSDNSLVVEAYCKTLDLGADSHDFSSRDIVIDSRLHEERGRELANEKKWDESDRIRDELFDKGVLIEDKDGKTLWKFK